MAGALVVGFLCCCLLCRAMCCVVLPPESDVLFGDPCVSENLLQWCFNVWCCL